MLFHLVGSIGVHWCHRRFSLFKRQRPQRFLIQLSAQSAVFLLSSAVFSSSGSASAVFIQLSAFIGVIGGFSFVVGGFLSSSASALSGFSFSYRRSSA